MSQVVGAGVGWEEEAAETRGGGEAAGDMSLVRA